jgi:hypothetical protein
MNLRRLQLMRTIVAIAALTLAGCSMPRLAYQQADWLLLREMDSYLDLRDEQRESIALALETHLIRHRAEHLPEFAAAFSEAAARARRGLAEDDWRWALEQGRALAIGTAELMLPTLATTLADLSPQQRRHLARRMAEGNDEYAESHALEATPQEQVHRTNERSVERIERWTGALSGEQIAMVHEASRAMPEMDAQWLTYVRGRQHDLLSLLDSGAPAPVIEDFLRGWWIRRDELPPELARKREQRIAARIELIARLDATLDSVQREYLVDRLQDLADDARSLVREA